MNSAILANEDQKVAAVQGWASRVEAWRQALEACRKKPSRKRVHGLRVATLRLHAELERWLTEAGAEDPAVPAAERWMRQAGRLRDVLKPIREADVYLGMLAELHGTGDALRKTRPRCSRSCRLQGKELERKLERQRESATEKLAKTLEDRHRRLVTLSRELETALGQVMARRPEPEAEDVRSLVEAVAKEHPVLSAENLHAYRKQLKAARYMAEQGAERDVVMRRQAACLSRMQTVAGEWHDWQTLAAQAERMLSKHDREDGLAELLGAVAEASLKKALSYCRRTTVRLLRHSADEAGEALPPKKPVKRAEIVMEPGAQRVG